MPCLDLKERVMKGVAVAQWLAVLPRSKEVLGSLGAVFPKDWIATNTWVAGDFNWVAK